MTDRQIDRAIAQGRAYDRQATKIVRARFDRRGDRIEVYLNTGAVVAVPRATLGGLSDVSPERLGSPTVEAPGYSIWFDKPDLGVRIETLLRAAVGDLIRSLSASELGSATTPAKRLAVRKNGRKGGRPMTMTSFVRCLDRHLHQQRPDVPPVDVGDNPNPQYPASATWKVGRHRLYVKFHGMKDVQVKRSWADESSPIQPRNAATAKDLARDLVRTASR